MTVSPPFTTFFMKIVSLPSNFVQAQNNKEKHNNIKLFNKINVRINVTEIKKIFFSQAP